MSDSADNPKAIVASTSQGTRFWGARARVVTPDSVRAAHGGHIIPGVDSDATRG